MLDHQSIISSPSVKKAYNYKPKLVDRKKMLPQEILELNLSEIF